MNRRVIRRRRRDETPETDAAASPTEDSGARRRPAVRRRAAEAEAAPTPAVEPDVAEAPAVEAAAAPPVAETPSAEASEPATEVPAAVEEAPAPASAPVEAPPAENASADEPVVAASEASQETAPSASADASNTAAESGAQAGSETAPEDTSDPSLQRMFPKLGSAVVALPPGYDPTRPNPAPRAKDAAPQRRWGAPAQPGSGGESSDSGRRRRRRVASGGGGGPSGGYGRPRPGRGRRRKSSGPKVSSPQPKAQKRKVRIDNVISVGQLAHEMSVKAAEVIRKLMEMDMIVSINEMLDVDTAAVIASEFEYEVENVGFQEDDYLQHFGESTDEEAGEPRPPVVTIMGHVDHGKTTLLDTIRESRVASGEAGGITQHIGAYQVNVGEQLITFLDTPGHAAFSNMRARGAQVTDIVILVVAADDGPQPQTVEAINHSKAAGVPIIVAVNKCDKPGVNPDTVKTKLGEYELIPEDWGGETLFANVSALKNEGIGDLLELVLLQAEMLDLRATEDRFAEGIVIEAKLQRGRGPVATVLVQKGTLKTGDHVVMGEAFGKVRALTDFKGKKLKEAGPSTPVEIFGLSSLPRTGDLLSVVENERNARKLAEHRARAAKEAEMAKNRRRTLEDLRAMQDQTQRKTLNLVIKTDVSGSLEALKAAVEAIDVEETEVRILHAAVGNISESDVSLVAANEGHLFGFNVKIDPRARKAADEAGVKPEMYSVIYGALDRVEGLLKGMLEPIYEEQHQGSAEVRATFNISRLGTIAGCYVLEGKIGRNHGARLYRDNQVIWEGDVSTLKRFKDDVREVASGYECGVALNGYNDIHVGDVIQTFAMVEVARE
ncbi:MAG: translation initiation factor IF-2 [Myxococcota bacterium]